MVILTDWYQICNWHFDKACQELVAKHPMAWPVIRQPHKTSDSEVFSGNSLVRTTRRVDLANVCRFKDSHCYQAAVGASALAVQHAFKDEIR